MKPLTALPSATARRLVGVAFDLDDTFLSHGALTEEAYGALHELARAGLKLAVVTGRPAGWCEVLARQWPVDGCVAENGAVYVQCSKNVVTVRDPAGDAERRHRRIRLAQLAADVREKVREAKLTGDANARVSDVTWDIGETQKMEASSIRRMRELCLDAGARVVASSIHLHASFDGADKASGLLRFAREVFSHDETFARSAWAFVGDSPNDAPCFAGLGVTFGVANVRRFTSALSCPPTYVAREEMGAGFAEIAAAILRARLDGTED